jgi:hypothetical protein
MQIFLSWSGERSKAVADALGPWLRQVIQALEPWVSTEIRKGTRWGPEVAAQLERTKVGIICLTRDNLKEQWILFESGALSKTKDAVVCTFLLDIGKADVEQPLAQFQHTTAEEDEVRQLVLTLNTLVHAAGDRALPDGDLDEVFDLFWPKLKAKLVAIPPLQESKKQTPVRSDGAILREILDLVRNSQTSKSKQLLEIEVSGPRRDTHRLYRLDLGPKDAPDVDGLIDALMSLRAVTSVEAKPREKGGKTLYVETARPAALSINKFLELQGVDKRVKRISHSPQS